MFCVRQSHKTTKYEHMPQLFIVLFQVPSGGFPCTYPGCGAVLKFKNNFRSHMNRHMGIYQYQCPYCKKGLSGTTHVKEHLKAHHTGLWGFHCITCKQELGSVHQLKTHLEESSCIGTNG